MHARKHVAYGHNPTTSTGEEIYDEVDIELPEYERSRQKPIAARTERQPKLEPLHAQVAVNEKPQKSLLKKICVLLVVGVLAIIVLLVIALIMSAVQVNTLLGSQGKSRNTFIKQMVTSI